MPKFNGDIVFFDSSGQIIADQGDLTLRADSTGSRSIIIGSGVALRPEVDLGIDLGTLLIRWDAIHAVSGVFNTLRPPVSGSYMSVDGSLSPGKDALYALGGAPIMDGGDRARWSNVYAASGIFNAIYPAVSGTGIPGNPDTWIEVGASLIPPTHTSDLTALYWLGTDGKFNKWAGISAVSGVFTHLRTFDLTVSSDTILDGDVFIAGEIDLTGGTDPTSIISDSVDWNASSSATFNTDFGTWNFNDTDVTFDKRPTTNTSGMMMEAENYFEVYVGRNVLIADPVVGLPLIVTNDGFGITPGDNFFTVSEDVQLRHYTVETVHLDANPAPWAFRLRIEGRDNDHASGLFNWRGTGSVPFTFRGTLSGTQTIPAGSRCRILTDTDGGAGHNTAFIKAWIGFTVVSGLSGAADE